jgi:rare lipoprotein A
MRMKLRLAIGSSVVTLALLGAARADQLPIRLTADADDTIIPLSQLIPNTPTAGTVVQIARVTQQVAQIASVATVAADPQSGGSGTSTNPASGNAGAKGNLSGNTAKPAANTTPRDQLADAGSTPTLVRPTGKSETGTAAWYGGRYIGRQTSSGVRLDTTHATCAHRTLPLNSLVRVTNLKNGRSVVVRVTDRGPVSPTFLIDMSPRAADELRMKQAGIVPVKVEQVVEASLPPK